MNVKHTAATLSWIAALLGLTIADAARPAVVEVTPTGFSVGSDLSIAAPARTVYARLLQDISKWWNPEHTYSHDSGNLSIEARPGGCFRERLPNGGGAEHARILNLFPGSLVRMSGALGPLQSSGLTGSLTFALTETNGTTKVQMTYNVGGYMHGGFESIAPVVDGVLRDQLQRLKTFVETHKTP